MTKRKRGARGRAYQIRIAHSMPLHEVSAGIFRDLLEGRFIELIGEKQAQIAAGVDGFFSEGVLVLRRLGVQASYRLRSTWSAWERQWMLEQKRLPTQEITHLLNADRFERAAYYARQRQAEIDLDCAMRHSTGGNSLHWVSEEQKSEVMAALRPKESSSLIITDNCSCDR